MSVRDLIPWNRPRNAMPAPRGGYDNGDSPFLTLHREINRLFDDVFRGFDDLPGFARRTAWPSLEVRDGDTEVRITAELPGMDEKDVELVLQNGYLTIRGEKREETVDEGRAYSERYYGRFERRIPLGFDVEEDKAEARFANGILTVTLPKPAEVQSRMKRIPIAGGGAR